MQWGNHLLRMGDTGMTTDYYYEGKSKGKVVSVLN